MLLTESLLTFLQGLPPEGVVAIIAAMPLTELRASIPLAMTVFHMNAWQAFFYSILGNVVPVAFLFLCFPWVVRFAENNIPFLHHILEKHFSHLEEKHRINYQKYGMIFLIVFVAIPFPGFGVWTGIPLSILFRMKYRYSVPAVCLGLLVLGCVVLFITEGSINIWNRI